MKYTVVFTKTTIIEQEIEAQNPYELLNISEQIADEINADVTEWFPKEDAA